MEAKCMQWLVFLAAILVKTCYRVSQIGGICNWTCLSMMLRNDMSTKYVRLLHMSLLVSEVVKWYICRFEHSEGVNELCTTLLFCFFLFWEKATTPQDLLKCASARMIHARNSFNSIYTKNLQIHLHILSKLKHCSFVWHKLIHTYQVKSTYWIFFVFLIIQVEFVSHFY